MTDYKATPAQWQQIENSQVFNGSFQACVLELRSRVEALEENFESFFESTNFCINTIINRLEKLEMEAATRDTVAKELKNSPLVEPKRSLIQRVHSCIVSEPECGHMQARAVIREVAHWMREQEGDYSMIRWLEMEIDD